MASAAISGLLAGPLRWFFRSALPESGEFEIDDGAGLALPEEASVTRDAYGVPHIRAGCPSDLWFLNGVVHAQDRLWQVHATRRLAQGRLAEFAGEKAVDLDRLARQLGFYRLARRDWAGWRDGARRMREELRANAAAGVRDASLERRAAEAEDAIEMVESYARGVNWVVDRRLGGAGRLPLEFHATGQRRCPAEELRWTEVDTLAVCRVHAFVMSFGFQRPLLRRALDEIFGEERAAAWGGAGEAGAEASAAGARPTPGEFADAIGFPGPGAGGGSRSAGAGLVAELLEEGRGSNAWAVSGRLMENGRAVLVGDPHLTIKIPNFWYELHLECPGIHAIGLAPPGIPSIFVGRTDSWATSITLSYCDNEDCFLERVREAKATDRAVPRSHEYLYKGEWIPFEEEGEELIRVKGKAAPVSCHYRRTRHGVVLDGNTLFDYAAARQACRDRFRGAGAGADGPGRGTVEVAYAGIPLNPFEPGRHSLTGVRAMLSATTFAEFDRALAYPSRVVGLNFVYADVDGNIGFVTTGETPVRSGERGRERRPLAGWTGEGEWTGFVPHASLPKACNPDRGYVVSANHRLVEYDDFPDVYLGTAFKAGFRARAIEEELRRVLEGEGRAAPARKLRLGDMKRILRDVTSRAAQDFVAEIGACELVPTAAGGVDAGPSPSVPVTDADLERALDALKRWGGELTSDSTVATLYQFTHSELVAVMIGAAVAEVRNENQADSRTSEAGRAAADFVSSRPGLFERWIFGNGFEASETVKSLSEHQGQLHADVLRILRSARDAASRSADPGRYWWLQIVGGRDRAITLALRAAVARMKILARDGNPIVAGRPTSAPPVDDASWISSPAVRWGNVHAQIVQHAISKGLGLEPSPVAGARALDADETPDASAFGRSVQDSATLNSPLDVYTLPGSGDTNTISQASPKSLFDFTATSSGVSLRMVHEMSGSLKETDQSFAIMPLGQSGQFNSPHYCDQRWQWHTGEFRKVLGNVKDLPSADSGANVMKFKGHGS